VIHVDVTRPGLEVIPYIRYMLKSPGQVWGIFRPHTRLNINIKCIEYSALKKQMHQAMAKNSKGVHRLHFQTTKQAHRVVNETHSLVNVVSNMAFELKLILPSLAG
jgi:hypothetical protein